MRPRILTSLSGRFLILTVLFVMIAEVLIFVPSIARYRLDYLTERMERAQIASLTLLAAGDMIEPEIEAELLSNAGVLNVVLRRDEMRQLVLSSDLPGPADRTVDLRDPGTAELIRDALWRYFMPEPEIIRVIGQPAMGGGLQIEAAIETAPLRAAMIAYGLNILGLSLAISAITAFFLFLAVRRLMVLPIRNLVSQMNRFAAAPEDARRIIEPASPIVELRQAETTLRDLETQLSQSLRQKERLAQLGGAVAKIAHDLRNILTTATLLGDRLERIDDPTVKRVAPKLVASLTRAVNLTEGTLAFGRAEEAPAAAGAGRRPAALARGLRLRAARRPGGSGPDRRGGPADHGHPRRPRADAARAEQPGAQRPSGASGGRGRGGDPVDRGRDARRLGAAGRRYRPRPAAQGAREPVRGVQGNRAQGRHRPRPRHRRRTRARPWRHAVAGALRRGRHGVPHRPAAWTRRVIPRASPCTRRARALSRPARAGSSVG